MEELMTLRFALKQEIMTSVRLATGGICALTGLGLDDGEDCKVCVTESLLLLARRGCSEAEIKFQKGNALSIVCEGFGQGESLSSQEEEISIALLSALVNDLVIEQTDGGYRISFGFGA